MVARDQPQQRSPLMVFAGGGTGGHLYPALGIAGALRDRLPEARFVFFCTQRPIDRRVLSRTGWEMVPQPLVSLRRSPLRWYEAYRGLRESSRLCRSRFAADSPAVVVGTGGLGSVPAVRAAARAGIPIALLNPDAVPGRANRFLAGVADIVFAQFPETSGHLPHAERVVVSGCPVRPEFSCASREAGCRRFKLDEGRKILLITGASQGAQTINEAVLANLSFLQSQRDWQVLHLTGEPHFQFVRQTYERCGLDAAVLPFTDHMADALAAAGLVVGRAGASFLAELTVVGRASVLMPYPFHRDDHQLHNALALENAEGHPAARGGAKMWPVDGGAGHSGTTHRAGQISRSARNG